MQHVLPGWVNFVQEHLLLSFLLLAEAYLLGTLMSLGWVKDIEDPQRWGIYHGIGVVLFFLGGAGAAGFAVRSSVASAAYFKRRQWFLAFYNQGVMWVITRAEVWASLSERSQNLHPTPADQTVLGLFGIHHAPVSPTVLVVACILPFASLSYGFSQLQSRRVSSTQLRDKAMAERTALERELTRAQFKSQIRHQQVQGWASAARAGRDAWKGRQDTHLTQDAFDARAQDSADPNDALDDDDRDQEPALANNHHRELNPSNSFR